MRRLAPYAVAIAGAVAVTAAIGLVSTRFQVLELSVLLAVALVTGQLAGSLRRTQSAAEALAADERAMYELATAALRSPEVSVALAVLANRAIHPLSLHDALPVA